MATAVPNPTPPEPRRFPVRLPHWGWFLLGTALLLVGYAGLSIWLPHYREQQIIQKINRWGGAAETKTSGPEWLRKLIGEVRLQDCKVFDRITKVNLSETAIPDSGIAELSGLSCLQVLDLDSTTVTDAGVARLSGSKKLEGLNLGGTTVTDAAMVHLGGLTDLQRLGLDGTKVTDAGLAHLSG